jgi:hypothetical protein
MYARERSLAVPHRRRRDLLLFFRTTTSSFRVELKGGSDGPSTNEVEGSVFRYTLA